MRNGSTTWSEMRSTPSSVPFGEIAASSAPHTPSAPPSRLSTYPQPIRMPDRRLRAMRVVMLQWQTVTKSWVFGLLATLRRSRADGDALEPEGARHGDDRGRQRGILRIGQHVVDEGSVDLDAIDRQPGQAAQ